MVNTKQKINKVDKIPQGKERKDLKKFFKTKRECKRTINIS